MRDEAKLESRRQKAEGRERREFVLPSALCLLPSLLSSLIPHPSSLPSLGYLLVRVPVPCSLNVSCSSNRHRQSPKKSVSGAASGNDCDARPDCRYNDQAAAHSLMRLTKARQG